MKSDSEKQTDGMMDRAGAHIRGVRAVHLGRKPWIKGLPIYRALSQHHIIHIGIQQTASPMKVVQPDPATTYFLAWIGGEGRVLINGRWRLCKPGFACLLLAKAAYAFKSVPGFSWKFCWVCYSRPIDQRRIAGRDSPIMARFETLPLESAIAGLLHECTGPGQPDLIQEWTDLAHAYVLRFAQTEEQVDSLCPLWERLLNQLSAHWTLPRLAREAGYSSEHLRRLCRAKLGRNPMKQVSYLRFRRAAELLTTTDQTIESIAREVGYQNPFVFSNAFTKSIGWRPSEYRRKRVVATPSLMRAA